MMLTEEDIEEFYAACRRDGFDLERKDAAFYAQRMLRLYQIISRPVPVSEGALAKPDLDATIEEPAVGRHPTSPPT